MKREDLLKTLKLAAPALLGDSEVVLPILRSLKFTGTHVIASNDIISACLSVPVTTPGIVTGKKLISFLSACKSKSAKFSPTKKSDILVKCAASKLILNCHPEDEWPYEFPDIEQAETISINENFFDAIELCSAQSPDTGIGGWQGGIVLVLGQNLRVYGVGQSRATISFCRVEGVSTKRKTDRQVVIPSSFCKLAASVSRSCGTDAKLHLTEDSAVIDWTDGENIVATRLMDVDMPDIVGRFNSVVTKGMKFEPITELLSAALRRAATIGDDGTCHIRIDSGKLLLSAKSDAGANLKDLVDFPKNKDFPAVGCSIAADLICKRLDRCGEVCFSDHTTVMRSASGTFIYVVANRSDHN